MNNKTINNISKFFKEKCSDPGDPLKPDEYKGMMDAANVLMYVPKTRLNQEAFNIFEGEPGKLPKMDTDKMNFCRFSKEYLKLILKTLIDDDNSDSISIGVAPNMPLIIEDKNNGFILAPRWCQESPINEWHDSVLKDICK
jgi:hypothetical protein